jgi:hypothetical protein
MTTPSLYTRVLTALDLYTPPSTSGYTAVPNYGTAGAQVLPPDGTKIEPKVPPLPSLSLPQADNLLTGVASIRKDVPQLASSLRPSLFLRSRPLQRSGQRLGHEGDGNGLCCVEYWDVGVCVGDAGEEEDEDLD